MSSRIKTIAGDETAIPAYVRSLLSRIAQITVLHLRDRRTPIGVEDAQRLLSLKVKRGGPEILRSIQDTVTALLGVKIDAFEGDTRGARTGEVRAEMDVDNFLVEVNGSGIREALRLILDAEFRQPNILLVEEPEVHLHPGLETGVMRYLRALSDDCQIFVTTHSTNFLDTGDVQKIFLVSKDHSTSVTAIGFEEAGEKLPQELGIRLSSLFMYDRLVFVEGQSDEKVLREFAATLGVNLSLCNVGFIALGGVRNMTHYAAEGVLTFLSRRQVRIWFILDRDERDEAEITSITARFGTRARCHFLDRRELENYLLVPRACAQYLYHRKQQLGVGDFTPPTTETVTSELEECAEKLKPLAIWKRVASIISRPIYPDRAHPRLDIEAGKIPELAKGDLESISDKIQKLQGQLDNILDQSTKSVEARWSRDKLSIVPGSDLLDAWCSKYGLRFDKTRDCGRLAATLARNEIDDPIRWIIEEIGRQ